MGLMLDERAYASVLIYSASVIDVTDVRQVGFDVKLIGLVPVRRTPPVVKALTFQRCQPQVGLPKGTDVGLDPMMIVLTTEGHLRVIARVGVLLE